METIRVTWKDLELDVSYRHHNAIPPGEFAPGSGSTIELHEVEWKGVNILDVIEALDNGVDLEIYILEKHF